MQVQTAMSGMRRAAIVALMLGEEATAEVLRHLSEEEVAALTTEMAGVGNISARVGEQVLEEFHGTAVAAEHVARGDLEFAKRVLNKTFGSRHRAPDVRPGHAVVPVHGRLHLAREGRSRSSCRSSSSASTRRRSR